MKQQDNNKMKTATTLAAILVASTISLSATAAEPNMELINVDANGMPLAQPALIDWSEKVQTSLKHKMDRQLDYELLAYRQPENSQIMTAKYNIEDESGIAEGVSFQFTATAEQPVSAIHVTVTIN